MTLGIFIYTPWGRLRTYEVLDTEDVDEAGKRYEETLAKTAKNEYVFLTMAGKDVEREHLREGWGLKDE